MNCKIIEKKLLFYVEGNLPENEKNSISKHLENCNSCAKKLAFIKENFILIDIEKKEKINPFIATKIQSKIAQRKLKTKTTFTKILQPVMIAVLLVIAVWFGNFISNSFDSMQTNNYQAQNNQNTDNAEQFAINDITYNDYYFISAQ